MLVDPNLEDHPAIRSIRDEGFLSRAIERSIPMLRGKHLDWFEFVSRVNWVGQRIMNSAEARCVGLTTHDPISVAARLLIRTLSGFQGAILLAERGMTLEARTLVRGLYENSLWLGYLYSDPPGAVDALLVEEAFSQRGRQRALLKQLERVGHRDADMRAELTSMIAAANVQLKGKRPANIEDLAANAGFEDFYMFYRQLSSGSAHASFHSLAQHLEMNEDGTWSGHITGPDGDGIGDVVNLATHALLSCLAAFNGVWPGGDGAAEVTQLLEEHLGLAGVRDGDAAGP